MVAKAPEFTLTNDKGEAVSLSDFRGKHVLVFFFPKAGTGGCTAQACGFRDAFPKIDAAGATVIGISPDKPAALAKWRAKENLPFVLLSDPDHKIAEAYGVWGEKTMYGRKFMGIIRSHFIIDEKGNLTESQIKVSPQDSVARGVKALHADG